MVELKITQPSEGADVREVETSITDLLGSAELCSVAVTDSGRPWVATMYFAVEAIDRLIVLTAPSTIHARAWQKAPVAVAVYSTSQPFSQEKRGLQMAGRARQANESELEASLTAYASRFPDVAKWLQRPSDLASIESRFFFLEMELAKVFDEPRFGQEIWIETTMRRRSDKNS